MGGLQKPNKNSRYHQGIFVPVNKEKYIGKNIGNITYRSSWELAFARMCDLNSNVIQWASESISVTYLNENTGTTRNYYIDFFLIYKKQDGSLEKCLIEIKPFSETQIPKLPKDGKKTKSYKRAIETYITNRSKWKAATAFCKSRGWSFRIITEKELFK